MYWEASKPSCNMAGCSIAAVVAPLQVAIRDMTEKHIILINIKLPWQEELVRQVVHTWNNSQPVYSAWWLLWQWKHLHCHCGKIVEGCQVDEWNQPSSFPLHKCQMNFLLGQVHVWSVYSHFIVEALWKAKSNCTFRKQQPHYLNGF